MEMKEISVTIEGTAPLLQHRYLFKDEAEVFSKKKSGSKDYSEEWRKALYWNPDVGLFQPATHVEGALIRAASNFQITGRGKKTYKDLIKSTVFVKPDIIPYGHERLDPDALLERGIILIHRAICVVQRARVERLRPLLPVGWRLSFTIELHDEQMPKEVVKEILDYSGKFVGIGDWRPRHGRFQVVRFE